MFGQAINAFLARVGTTELIDGVILVMLVTFLVALVSSALGLWRRFTMQAATILTSIGILGTFAGMVVGLHGFDASAGGIDASVQGLLAGVRTAFTSSLIGMMLAIVYRVATTLPFLSRPPRASSPAALPERTADALDTLVELARSQLSETGALREIIGDRTERRLLEAQGEVIERLRASLVDDVETGLCGQLQRLRAELAERHRSHGVEFAATNRLGRMQAKLLHGLLTEMGRFGTRGEDFQPLNEAVARLVDWQENYRVQLDDMRRQYDASVRAITSTERSVDAIAEHSAAIPAQMERLAGILEANDSELEQLRAHLVAFADAREQAVRAVPEIGRLVADTVSGLDEAGRSLTSGVQSSAESMIAAVRTAAEHCTRASESTNEDARAITRRTREESMRLFDRLEDAIQEAYRLSSESTERLVNKEFTDMELVRQEQVKRVMDEMGTALATITGKFTEDYAELIRAMDEIVREQPVRLREVA